MSLFSVDSEDFGTDARLQPTRFSPKATLKAAQRWRRGWGSWRKTKKG